jgi:cytochrome P450
VLLGLSVDETLAVVDCVKKVLHSGYDVEMMRAGTKGILSIEAELVERRRRQPGDDLISLALAAQIDGKPLSEFEIRGMFFFFLFAGLDTIAAATGFMFRYLAEHAEVRGALAADPSKIGDAIEDSLRRHGQITTNRFVKKDVEVGGVKLKQGDNLLCSLVLANLDAALFDKPLDVDITRSSNPHLAFGAGPHRCIGSNIARLQLRVTVEEWLRRIPEFRVAEGGIICAVNSEALVLESLPLVWPPTG